MPYHLVAMPTAPEPYAPQVEADRWTSGTAIVAYLAATLFLVHMAFARNYGYFVDELYHLACAEHLAWGYVDQPSLIAVIGWVTRKLLGDSLPAIRFFPALAAAGKVILTGMIAREMGARRSAQALAALCVMVAPVYLFMDHIFTMNAFEPLFWMGCAWLVLRILRTGNQKLWLAFGALAGVGLHNKYSMLFFGLGVFAGVLLTPARRTLRQPWIWLGGLLALLIFLPNIFWNIQHDFPFLQLQQNIRASGRNVALNAVGLMLFAFLPVLMGLVARVALPDIDDPNLVLPALLREQLPAWLGALAMAAVFSTEVDTCDAILFMISTSASKDLYKRYFRPEAGDAELLRVARLAAVVGGTVGVMLSIYLTTVISALTIFYSILGVSLFVPVVGGLYTRRAGSGAAMAAIAAGVVALLLVRVGFGDEYAWLDPTLVGLLAASAAFICITAVRTFAAASQRVTQTQR